MRLSNFLLNENFANNISINDAIEIINKNCIKNFKYMNDSDVWIYRGDSNLINAAYVSYSKNRSERKSANTTNEYTYLFSEILDSWKKYPKRNKSIICSTSEKYAADYGNVYYVIPFDKTSIGICPQSDLWTSFKKGLDKIFNNTTYISLNNLNMYLRTIFYFDDNNSEIKNKKILNTTLKDLIDDAIKSKRFSNIERINEII